MRHDPHTPELIAEVLSLRTAGRSYQQIATAMKRHPATCRNICLAAGLPLMLQDSYRKHAGNRADWERKRLQRAAKPSARDPLPAGHPITWRAISVAPWPGAMAL